MVMMTMMAIILTMSMMTMLNGDDVSVVRSVCAACTRCMLCMPGDERDSHSVEPPGEELHPFATEVHRYQHCSRGSG